MSLASSINWLRIWEDARDNGQFWTKITQQFYKLITTPLFEECQCPKCKELIPISTSFIEHFQSIHQCPTSIQQVLCELKDSHNCSMNTFHSMRLPQFDLYYMYNVYFLLYCIIFITSFILVCPGTYPLYFCEG